MQSFQIRWRNLFLFCLGITIATAFIMQWLASDFWVDNQKFSIFGLELFYSQQEIISVLTRLKQPARIALNYHLIFDFAFMTGVYPGIASLCMIIREKITHVPLNNLLFALAMLQPVAWAFDIVENGYLLRWMATPQIGDEFSMYHNMVAAKWIIALCGIITAMATTLFTKRKRTQHPSSAR